ncbi:MAG: MFS transporter [Alphaproteobacteria bacterium]
MNRISRADSIETGYGWAVIVISTLMIATAFGSSYLVTVALKPIEAEFGVPRWLPSSAYGLALLGAGIGGILMGMWSDRQGMFRPALLGAVMLGTGAIVASQAPDIYMLLAAHLLLIGLLGNASTFSPMLTNATRWFDRRRGLAVAIVGAGQSLAGAVWPPIFSWSIGTYGWRQTMLMYGIFAVAAMLPMAFVFRRPPPVPRLATSGPAERMPGDLVLGLAPNLVLAMVFFAIIGCCVAMAMPMVHIVAYCSDLGYDPARGAEMLSLLLACAFVSRLGFGWLADRIGGLKTILMGASAQAVMLAVYAGTDGLVALYVVSGIFGLVFGGIVPSYALVGRELFPASEAGWRIGVIFLGGTIGMGLGGVLGGAIYDITGGYSYAFLTGVGFNLLNLALIGTLVFRHSEPDMPARAPAHA